MKIPKTFQLMGQTITVQLELPEDVTDEQATSAYCYFVVYEILDTMEEIKLRDNNKFVSLFSGLLHQALTTGDTEEFIVSTVKVKETGKTIGFKRTNTK